MKEEKQTSEPKLTVKITYYSVFQNIGNILQERYLLLTPDKEHKKVFPNVPVVRFCNGKSLKACLCPLFFIKFLFFHQMLALQNL